MLRSKEHSIAPRKLCCFAPLKSTASKVVLLRPSQQQRSKEHWKIRRGPAKMLAQNSKNLLGVVYRKILILYSSLMNSLLEN